MTVWTRLFRRRQLEIELDEELRTHLNMAAADRVARGEPPAKAASAAGRESRAHSRNHAPDVGLDAAGTRVARC
jgi:hypothetical protein